MKLLVIDSNSIVNRAFYGIRELTTKDGIHTNAIYGFMNIFFKLRELTEPDAVAFAFDLKAPTFRHKMYDEYKAGRKPMPEELCEQIPLLKELLRYMGYSVVEKEGYEADDILGTLSYECASRGDFCYIATGDRDSLQLVNKNVSVILAGTKAGQAQSVIYTPAEVREKYGVEPEKLIDIKAIQGDASDNIPGVAGIGEKGARDLISRFGNIDYIYDNIDTIDIKDGVRNKLKTSEQACRMSRKLGEICLKAPVNTDIESYVPAEADKEETLRLLRRLEMFSTIKKLNFSAEPEEKSESKEYIVEYEAASDASDLLKKLTAEGKAYFTVDFDGENVLGLVFALGGKIVYLSGDNLEFYSFIKKLFESGIKKYVDNSKPVFTMAEKYSSELNNVAMDCSLAAYLANPNAKDYSLMSLAAEYGINLPECDAGEKSGIAKEAAVLPVLCEKLSIVTQNNFQQELLYDIEIPLAEVLGAMESEGVRVDAVGIKAFGEKIAVRIAEITEKIYTYVGREFNLNSPKQLGSALFEDLKLPCKKKTKTGYSTNAEVLENLSDAHPVIPLILEYRTLSKLKSTYCDGLLKVISPDGRIHSSFNQTETRTGRISSTEPNLQNIPVRTELGAELRKYFLAKEGSVLVDADYSQIELRVLSHIADDKNMQDAFNNGDDIHAITASQVFGVPLSEVTPQMRRRAKAVNFGIVYGIGAFSLAKDIGVSRAEADSYIKGYLMHYSGIDEYMKNVVCAAKDKGYAQTVFGRRRYLPELNSSNHMTRAFGERVARNMPIQGTAADIIKIAMVHVYARLRAEKLNSKLILQVHDELIIEADESEKGYVEKLLKEEMENACIMKVKLRADVHSGKTWFEAKE